MASRRPPARALGRAPTLAGFAGGAGGHVGLAGGPNARGKRDGGTPRRARLGALAALALALGAGACSGILRGAELDPQGRSITDLHLRRLVSTERADSALAWLRAEPDRLPGDDVLDHLYFGALTHHAGLYEESSLWLRAAYELAEDRYSRSVSRSALSLLVNDRVLPYEPGETERLLIHYYNAKNHLALGDMDGAAVEARRLSLLLDRFDADSEPTDLRAGFRAFASAVFAAAGESDDAEVAARKARAQGASAWWDAPPARHPAADDAHPGGPAATAGAPISAEARPPAGSGRIVVVIEHGRVAQLVEETAYLTLDDDDRDHLRHGDRRRAFASLSLARELAPEAADSTFLAALEEAGAAAEREAAEEAADTSGEAGGSDRNGSHWRGEPVVGGEPAEGKAPVEGQTPVEGRAPVEGKVPGSTGGEAPVRKDGTAGGSGGGGSGGADRTGEVEPAPPAAPVLEPAGERLGGRVRAVADDRRRGEDDDRLPYVMRLAWAAYRPLPERPRASIALEVDGRTGEAARLPLDLSAGVMADEADGRAWAIARAVARAWTKLAIARAIEEEAGEENEAVGRILGAVANAGAVFLERADTRSWALVPDRVEILRIDLPPGEHALALRSSSGAALDLGTVRVAEGATTVVFGTAKR